MKRASLDDRRIPELLEEREWMQVLARRLTRCPETAGDLVQETWVRLLRRTPGGERPLRGWIHTVMANAARNLRRDAGRREAHELDWSRDRADAWVDPDAAEHSEVVAALRQAFDGLDAPHREVLTQRYVANRSPRAIARELGIPAATVRSRTKRALDRLRAELDRRHGGNRSRWTGLLAAWARGPVGPAPKKTASGPSNLVRAPQVVGLATVAVALVVWVGPDSVGERRERVLPAENLAGPEPLALLEPAARAERVPVAVPPVSPAPPLANPRSFHVAAFDPAGAPLTDLEVRSLDLSLESPHNRALMDRHPRVLSDTPGTFTTSWEAIEERYQERCAAVALMIRAPGFAWARCNVTESTVGDLACELEPEARLRIELELPDEVPDEMLRFSPSGYDLPQWTRLTQNGRLEGTRWTSEWKGLAAGTYVLEVVCGHESPDVLWSRELVLPEGETTTVQARVPPEPPRPEMAELAGTLAVPWQAIGSHARIDVVPNAPGPHARPVSIRVSCPEDAAARSGPVEWDAGPLAPGEYRLLVQPIGLHASVDLHPGQRRTVALEVPALARVEVVAVDADTGEPRPLEFLRWWAVTPDPADAQPDERTARSAEGRTGSFELLAAPGRLALCVENAFVPGSLGWSGRAMIDAVPGEQRVSIRVRRNAGLGLRFLENGDEVVFAARGRQTVRVSRVDGKPAWIRNRVLQHGFVEVGTPGLYRIEIDTGSSYRPIPPLEVELFEGQVAEQIVHYVLR